MSFEMKIPKKLIEVALPLDAINAAAAKEKSIRFGHPSTMHLWWARRPLAAARAVIFSQLVNDPGYERNLGRGVNKEKARAERERLFRIIEKLVLWESTNDEVVLKEAREEIWKSWRETCSLNKDHPQAKELFNPEQLPEFHDPFAGGGAIPLEAQRLGLSTYATDLNPVAVTINKAMIEIPSKFFGVRPVGPKNKDSKQEELEFKWVGALGIAEDVRRYGNWMRERAYAKLQNLYPKVKIDKKSAIELGLSEETELTVVTWIWARTVKSPNPAFSHVDVPLISTFMLSSKEGKEVYLKPKVDRDSYSFSIQTGKTPDDLKLGTTAGKRSAFKCIVSGVPIDYEYIRDQGKQNRIGTKLIAIVADGPKGRIYLPSKNEHEEIAKSVVPTWAPDVELPNNPRDFKTPNYGIKTFRELFTSRQLHSLNVFSDLVSEAVSQCFKDATAAGFDNDERPLSEGGTGAKAYSESIGIYLGLGVSRMADINNSLCMWETSKTQVRHLFTKQAIPMLWDFAEPNIFSDSAGDFAVSLGTLTRVLERFSSKVPGTALQADARSNSVSTNKIISTDPPYYDNIAYADLSDFFYIWLKRTLGTILPSIYESPTTPKEAELVASPYRHGDKKKAEDFFLEGMKSALKTVSEKSHKAFPVTIYYAFKQSETKSDSGTSSTGWETFLEAVLSSGFTIAGTWPMRTELGNRMIGSGKNALASSIVLVCNRRDNTSQAISRREFLRELNSTLPEALQAMTSGEEHSPVAPVDLSQAIIGPGMAIFSKYSAVLEADGKPMTVRTALQLINRFFAEDDFDHDTQFCMQWFDQNGWNSGKFGEADVLARAKGTSVEGLKEAGIVESSGGNLKLKKPSELPVNWRPESDSRVSVWELLHHMIARFSSDGSDGAGEILSRASQLGENIRTLAYRLFTVCERKAWSQDAGAYDSLVRAWDSIERAASDIGFAGTQISLFNTAEAVKPETKTVKTKATRKK